MLFKSGLISRSEIVETSGLNLTGEYVGSTKKKVQDYLDKAKGGVLFIDEAYELGKGTFGSEACSTLVEAMTNDAKYGGLVIIMAGYQADIQTMLDTNQGLKSRFNRFIEFPDWEIKDCTAFFCDLAKGRNLSLQNHEYTFSLLHKGFSKLKPLKGWGNARDVVKLFESTLENRAMRLHQERCEDIDDAEGKKIIAESDVCAAIQSMVDARMGSSSTGIKRGDEEDDDPFAELDNLYRMDKVKEKLQQLKNTYLVAQQDGDDPPPLGHFIFTGSPGTGKTTGKSFLLLNLYFLSITHAA
jgi:SpoVK/Ycf46/Vps4 family AAA+-type ATPase